MGEEYDEELSELFTKLWNLDDNYCDPGEHYEIDLQGYVRSTTVGKDMAKSDFFTFFDEDKVFAKDTYRAFKNLLDNYETEVGAAETVTSEEVQENIEFLNAAMETEVMKETHAFLRAKDLAPADPGAFRRLIYDLWFRMYKRDRNSEDKDSSGFEHVFVGETRDDKVIGLHNWIQLYLEEKAGNIDYKGYFRRGTSNEEQPRMVTLQFVWHGGSAKPIGSSFIGTSPEFEVALYTICFLVNRGTKIKVHIAEYDVEMSCYRLGRQLGTCYPNLIE